MVGSHQVAGVFDLKNCMAVNSSCLKLHISQNVATLMSCLTSQSCGDSLPAVCLAGQVGAINRSPKHQWLPDRLVNKASVKVDR